MSQYIPKPDAEGINSPLKTQPIRDLVILISGFIAVFGLILASAIFVGEWVISQISSQTEMKYFSRLWQAPGFERKTPKDLKNLMVLLNQHVNLPLKIAVTCNAEPNAMALPGGAILVTSGLLANIQSENGLAFILGHEMGHFVNRDHLRGMSRSLILGLVTSLMGLNGIDSNLATISQFSVGVYDRRQESSADEFGLKLVKKTFGHTRGAEELFTVLAKKETSLEKAFQRFSGTHPPSSERLAFIQAAQAEEPSHLQSPPIPFSKWIEQAGCK